MKVMGGDDHQLKQLLIVKQILLVSLFGNVWGTVWRISILMLGRKGLTLNTPNPNIQILYNFLFIFPVALDYKENFLTSATFLKIVVISCILTTLHLIQG